MECVHSVLNWPGLVSWLVVWNWFVYNNFKYSFCIQTNNYKTISPLIFPLIPLLDDAKFYRKFFCKCKQKNFKKKERKF